MPQLVFVFPALLSSEKPTAHGRAEGFAQRAARNQMLRLNFTCEICKCTCTIWTHLLGRQYSVSRVHLLVVLLVDYMDL